MSAGELSLYPEAASERDVWVLARRGVREAVSVERPYAFLVEQERSADGLLVDVATVFLTNRECPWRCAMCDLWRYTLAESVPMGAIPQQVRYALERLGPAAEIKLYNSGSFFDARAVPPEDDAPIAELVAGFRRVVVESHPSLVGDRCLRFAERLRPATLEVAMGLETAHPGVLAKLNKRMTLEDYGKAAERLAVHGIALRSFVLVQPPFMRTEESLEWACRSIDFALGCGASAVTLIPTRAGNGAMETLALAGEFRAPALSVVEHALAYGLATASVRDGRARVFVDLWDAERVAACAVCGPARRERLARMNLLQQWEARPACDRCGGEGA